MSSGLKELCESCTAAEACRTAFGKYWTYRSNGGVGCNLRFPAGEARSPAGRGKEPWEGRTFVSGRRERGVF